MRNKLWYVNIAREEKNPYIQQVLAMEEELRQLELQNAKAEDLAADDGK